VHDIVTADGAFGGMFGAEVERTGVVKKTADVFDRARSRGLQIVYTRVCYQPGHVDLVVSNPLFGAVAQFGALVDGTRGAEIIDELSPQSGDLVVSNNRVNGFVNSSLDFTLRNRNINTIVLTGVATNITIESTARTATDLGYRAIVLADCVSAASQEHHDAAIGTLGLLAEVSTSENFLTALG
jgi:nicotinamidase-related amidase